MATQTQGSSSTFLYPSLTCTARKGKHRTLGVYVLPAIKHSVTPVSLRAPQKPHKGQFFRFRLVSLGSWNGEEQGLVYTGQMKQEMHEQ